MTYFHATTKDRIESIQKHGLGGLPGVPKAFPDCADGVYLAADPMLALGFLLERALADNFFHMTPKKAVEQFAVFAIDDSRVNVSRLQPDPNILQEGFWLYNGIVDVSAMPVLSADDVTRSHYNLESNSDRVAATGSGT